MSAYVALFFTIIFVFVCNCSFVTTTSNHSRPHTERAMSSMPPPPPLVFGAEVDGFNKHDSTRTDDASQDLGVLRTNDEASGAKHCCVQRGYYDDPFVKHFAKTTPKHPPLINRGYHSRVATVRAVLDAFLDATFEFDAAGDDGVMPRGGCFTKAGNGTENAGASSQASVSEVPVTPREVVLPTLVDSNDASAKAR